MANFNYSASGKLSFGGFGSSPNGNPFFEIMSGYRNNHSLNKVKNPYLDASASLQRLHRLKRYQDGTKS